MPKMPPKHAALLDVEPGGVDLDHRQGAEALEILVDGVEQRHADDDLGLPAGQEQGADDQVEQRRADAAEDDGLLAAEAVGQRAVEDDAQGVGPEAGGGDGAELGLGEVEGLHDVAGGDVEVVAPHVEGGVGQPQREPVQEAPAAVLGRVVQRVARQSSSSPPARWTTACSAPPPGGRRARRACRSSRACSRRRRRAPGGRPPAGISGQRRTRPSPIPCRASRSSCPPGRAAGWNRGGRGCSAGGSCAATRASRP